MMHRLASSVAVLDCEISEIRLLIERYAGMLLERSSESLGEAITDYLEAQRITSATDLIALLQHSSEDCDALLECLIPGDTAFFRFPAVFDALTRQVVPELRARKLGDPAPSMRMWSAGCSSGEEAYSVGMAVCEALHHTDMPCNIHVLGSDIRSSALETAQRGVYAQAALQAVPKHLVGSYFSRIGDQFMVKPRLANLVTFTSMNLANPAFLGRYDCIFCLDVLPHFSAAQRTALVQRLHMFLEPGGYLCLGEKEKLPAADGSFIPQIHLGYTYYQRPFAAAAKVGR